MGEVVPTFVQRVKSYDFFHKAIENRQLTYFFVIVTVFHPIDFASDKLDILRTSTELQEYELKILSLIQRLFQTAGKSVILTIHGW